MASAPAEVRDRDHNRRWIYQHGRDVYAVPRLASDRPLGEVRRAHSRARWVWRCLGCLLWSVDVPGIVATYRHPGTAAHRLRVHALSCRDSVRGQA